MIGDSAQFHFCIAPFRFKSIVLVRCCRLAILALKSCVKAINGPAQMRNCDRAADHERHIKNIEKLGPGHSGGYTLFDVISNTIVTAKHYRGDQTEEFFSTFVEGAIFVGLRVERKKALEAQMIAPEQLFVHVRPVAVKFIHRNKPFRRAADPDENAQITVAATHNSKPFYLPGLKVARQGTTGGSSD